MEKIEFMAMSLPYGLYCEVSNGKVNYNCVKQNNVDYALEFTDKLITSIPILYPISDIRKEIAHKGKKIIPVSEILKDQRSDNNVEHLLRLILNCNTKEMCLILPFWVVQRLVEWHFDVAGLIEKREAVNINTLPNKDDIYF